MKTSKTLISFLLFACTLTVIADEGNAQNDSDKKLTGSYFIGGKSLADSPENEPQDTHYYIHLEGESAESLYKIMKAEPEFDFCTSSMEKRMGDISCIESNFDESGNKNYECWFGIEIESQKITQGVIC